MSTIPDYVLRATFTSGTEGVAGTVYIHYKTDITSTLDFIKTLGLKPKPPHPIDFINLGGFLNWYCHFVIIPVSDTAKVSIIPMVDFKYACDGSGGLLYVPNTDDAREGVSREYLKLIGYDTPEDLLDTLVSNHLRREVVAHRIGEVWDGTAKDLNYRYLTTMCCELPEFWKALSERHNYPFDFNNYPKSVYELGGILDTKVEEVKDAKPIPYLWLGLALLYFSIGLLVGRMGI